MLTYGVEDEVYEIARILCQGLNGTAQVVIISNPAKCLTADKRFPRASTTSK
jgi:hypothetical protein